MVSQDQEIHDVIENTSLVYNNQLKFFDDNIIKKKPLSKSLEYLQKNCFNHNQDCHHHYQYNFHHKKLLLREKK